MKLAASSAMRGELQTLGAKVSLAERAVAMDLALLADEHGRPTVAAATGYLDRQTGIAWRTGLDRRTVQRALARLSWLGVISCKRPARGTRPTLWRLSCVTLDAMPPDEPRDLGPPIMPSASSRSRGPVPQRRRQTAPRTAPAAAQHRPKSGDRPPLVPRGGESPPLASLEAVRDRPLEAATDRPSGGEPPYGGLSPPPTRPATAPRRKARGAPETPYRRNLDTDSTLARARIATFVASTDDPLDAKDVLWQLFAHEPAIRAVAWSAWEAAHPEPEQRPAPGVPDAAAYHEARRELEALGARKRR